MTMWSIAIHKPIMGLPRSFNHFGKLIALIIGISLLSGCQLFKRQQSSANIDNIEDVRQWVARGKIMLAQNKEKVSGYFYWQQDNKDFEFSLSTFIGIDVFSLDFKDGIATLKVDGETYRDSDPQRLIQQLTGHDIPVNQLDNWMLGRYDTQHTGTKFDANGYPKSFEYLAANELWSISYNAWQPVNLLMLPASINLKSSANRIKISITNWELKG